MTMIVKTTRFIIHRLTPCVRCRGKAWIKNPIYDRHAEWKGDFYKRNKFIPSRMEDLAWWADQGFKKGFPDDPEIICPDCKGQGEISNDIDLIDAISAVEAIAQCPADNSDGECTCGHHHLVASAPDDQSAR